MTRARWILLGIVLVLLWGTRFVVNPRPVRGPTDAVAEKQLGDQAFDSALWWEASRHYRAAFALEPARSEDRRAHRAFLAQQTAAAFGRIVTEGPTGLSIAERRTAKGYASLWLDEALALDASRGWLHYERATLHDQGPEELREPDIARAAYEAFVRWVEDEAQPGRGKPKSGDPAVAAARQRIEALAG